jgi:hypothetical protein
VRHLDRTVMQDLVEGGAAGGPTAAHLDACRTCRDELEALRRVWQDVAGLDVPEPSPLFWTHMAARVGHAVRAEAAAQGAPRRGPWAWRRWWLPAGAVAGAAVAVWLARLPGDPAADTSRRAGAPPEMVASQTSEPDLVDETARGGWDVGDAWELVLAAAGDAPWETEQLVAPVPAGAAEDAAGDLSAAERVELERLLRRELGMKAG